MEAVAEKKIAAARRRGSEGVLIRRRGGGAFEDNELMENLETYLLAKGAVALPLNVVEHLIDGGILRKRLVVTRVVQDVLLQVVAKTRFEDKHPRNFVGIVISHAAESGV